MEDRHTGKFEDVAWSMSLLLVYLLFSCDYWVLVFINLRRCDVTDFNYLEMLIEKAHSMNPAKFSGKDRPDCFLKMVGSILCLQFCVICNDFL